MYVYVHICKYIVHENEFIRKHKIEKFYSIRNTIKIDEK